jgi:Transposase domain (DUF772)
LLLQAFYSVRSEHQLMEQLGYNMLFRWFVGLSLDAVVWDVTVFTKNRERLIAGDIAAQFMAAVLNQERIKALLSDEHFSVDGTLIEAWASMKSFRPKDGSRAPPAPGRNGERDFHGEKRSNETHASTTDRDARLYRKGPGQPAKLAYLGHVFMENRHALVVDTRLSNLDGSPNSQLYRPRSRRRLFPQPAKAETIPAHKQRHPGGSEDGRAGYQGRGLFIRISQRSRFFAHRSSSSRCSGFFCGRRPAVDDVVGSRGSAR